MENRIKVRGYEDKDRASVEEICHITDRNNLPLPLLLTLYCHNYILLEGENCFVATDESDRAVGYILSTLDTAAWREKFISFLSSSSEEIRRKGIESVEGYFAFYPEYPAHLHIDIDPSYQRMGIGKALMDTLVSHLRKNKVPGLMLGVDPSNEKGVSFYKKYGFSPLSQDGVWWGLKL